MEQLQDLIDNDYRVHMQLDNLPVAIHDNRCALEWPKNSFPFFIFFLFKLNTMYVKRLM